MSDVTGNPHVDSPTPSFLDRSFDYVSETVGKGVDWFDSIFDQSNRYSKGVLDQLENITNMSRVINAASDAVGGRDDIINTSGLQAATDTVNSLENRSRNLEGRMQRLKEVLENRETLPVPIDRVQLIDIPDATVSKNSPPVPPKKKRRDRKSRYRVID